MANLKLGNSGKFAFIDDEDVGKTRAFWWSLVIKGPGLEYARGETEISGRRLRVSLHRLVLGLTAADRSIEVDHISGDGLDCRKENLRTATRGENAKNRAKRKATAENPYKGVSFRPKSGTWLSYICPRGRMVVIGVFATAAEAARSYDAKARELYGEYARLNFPSG